MSLQFIIILIYLGITVFLGMLARGRASSAGAFHGAHLGVLMCVAAGTGEWLGGTSTTGVAEYGYLFGLSGAWFTLANGIGVVFLAFFFARLYRSLGVVTIPGIIERFIGTRARVVSSILLTFVMLSVGTAQVIAAGTLSVVVLGIDFTPAALIFGSCFIAYTFWGGMTAVGYTNIMHLFFMYGGVILALVVVLTELGGVGTIVSALPASPYFSMTGIGLPKVFSWIVAGILGACTAQAGIQPLLAAKDAFTARKAAFITAVIVAPFGLLTAFLGIAARVYFPHLTDAKLALPTLMMDLPPVIGGVVLASVVAAILSTVSPIILACGTMITKDIYERCINPHAMDKKILTITRIMTSAAGVVCTVFAIIIYHNGARILDIVYFAYTLRGGIFVVLLFGIYWKKTSEPAAIKAMLCTAVTGFFWVFYKDITGHYPVHPALTESYAALFVAFTTTTVFSFFDRQGRG